MTTTIFERVATVLDGLSIPYASQLYRVASGDSLPDVFMVYFLVDARPAQHADDAERLRSNMVQVSVYSRSGLADLPAVDGAMVSAGFHRAGEVQLPYDPETGHYGLAKTYIYMEEET